MELEIIHNERDSRFEAHIDEFVAFVQYVKSSNNLLTITSTQVPKELGGRGIAGEVTKHVLEYAREHNLLVSPMCSYTVAYFEKYPEYSDLLKED